MHGFATLRLMMPSCLLLIFLYGTTPRRRHDLMRCSRLLYFTPPRGDAALLLYVALFTLLMPRDISAEERCRHEILSVDAHALLARCDAALPMPRY